MSDQEKVLALARKAAKPLRPQELAQLAGDTGASQDAVRALMAEGRLILTPDRRVRVKE
jgi:hypothetical protein